MALSIHALPALLACCIAKAPYSHHWFTLLTLVITKDDKPLEKVITLRGTVTEIVPQKGPHPHQKWLVTFSADEVCDGVFEDRILYFYIHSPTKSGIVTGGYYVLQIECIKPDKYKLISVMPWKEPQ